MKSIAWRVDDADALVAELAEGVIAAPEGRNRTQRTWAAGGGYHAPGERQQLKSGGDGAHALPTSEQRICRQARERAAPCPGGDNLDALKRRFAQADIGQGEDLSVYGVHHAYHGSIDSAQAPDRTNPR